MGWYHGGRITDYDTFIDQYNYPEFLRDFIREYGGMKIKNLNVEGHLKDRYRTSLIPLDSDGMSTDSVAEDYSADLGRKLYVLRLYSSENFDIAADENGAVYFLGEYCKCVGKNLHQGIESIIRMDSWSQLELDALDTTSGKWFNIKSKEVDFDTHEFDYKLF